MIVSSYKRFVACFPYAKGRGYMKTKTAPAEQALEGLKRPIYGVR